MTAAFGTRSQQNVSLNKGICRARRDSDPTHFQTPHGSGETWRLCFFMLFCLLCFIKVVQLILATIPKSRRRGRSGCARARCRRRRRRRPVSRAAARCSRRSSRRGSGRTGFGGSGRRTGSIAHQDSRRPRNNPSARIQFQTRSNQNSGGGGRGWQLGWHLGCLSSSWETAPQNPIPTLKTFSSNLFKWRTDHEESDLRILRVP